MSWDNTDLLLRTLHSSTDKDFDPEAREAKDGLRSVFKAFRNKAEILA